MRNTDTEFSPEEIDRQAGSAIYRAARQAETADLMGEHSDGYERVEEKLKASIELLGKRLHELTFLRTHAHEWSENGYCVHCKADGRA